MIQDIFNHRRDLGSLCNEMGLTWGVEVGTHQGVFADEFMSKFNGKLTCVDPWEGHPPPQHATWLPAFVETSTSRELDMQIAKLVLETKYPGRVEFWRETSSSAADRFRNESVPFVYIDGSHKLSDVARDIDRWWRKIMPGGVLAGHDYVFGNPNKVGDHNLFSVKIAVDYFVASNCLDLYLTNEPIASWYVEKWK